MGEIFMGCNLLGKITKSKKGKIKGGFWGDTPKNTKSKREKSPQLKKKRGICKENINTKQVNNAGCHEIFACAEPFFFLCKKKKKKEKMPPAFWW